MGCYQAYNIIIPDPVLYGPFCFNFSKLLQKETKVKYVKELEKNESSVLMDDLLVTSNVSFLQKIRYLINCFTGHSLLA